MIIMDRTRRLRMNATLRDMIRENHVRVDELIYPVFVTEENDVIQEVPSMPGICQYSLDHVLEEIGRAVDVGIKGILLFGIPVHKDEVGSEAYDEEGVVCRAIRLIKDAYPELVIMADVCLCEYTSHGHCGLVKDGVILNVYMQCYYIGNVGRKMIIMDRTRRLRMNATLRDMIRENHVRVDELIYPVFVTEENDVIQEVPSMPGICQYSLDHVLEEIGRAVDVGIKGILLFGIPVHKDEVGSEAYDEEGVVCRAIRLIKDAYPELVIMADVCLCEYTSHGHCGLVKDGVILNDETLPLLAKASVAYAKAGADIIAPSDMMDKRVEAIRNALDEAGLVNIPICSYSAKFASGYYGPFRDAAHSAPGFGDRKTYQMDPANGKEALREVEEDILEGADMIIAKPALGYMDVMKEIALNFNIPIVAYNVSGEYTMVKAAAMNGWIDEKKIVMENMTGFKRAGAKMIITYHAIDVAKWLKEE